MTAAGRRLRVATVVMVGALLVAGSWKGSDHDFPFGPFRMYATSGRSTGGVRAAVLVAVHTDGTDVVVDPAWVGLRRAELEGHYRSFAGNPRLLADLAALYERRQHVRLRSMVLEESIRRVVDREVQGGPERRSVVAEWHAPG